MSAATDRKLVTVRTVSEVNPIPGADNIEVASVDGWKIVVKKGEFKAGDLCAYFEIDSFLPERPEFEFLRKSSFRTLNGNGGFRLRTIKLRKQVSQGLALPLGDNCKRLGDDLTEVFGVVKWDTEPQDSPEITPEMNWFSRLWRRVRFAVFGKKRDKRGWPAFVPKTDEARVQNLSSQLHMWQQHDGVTVTEKLDGSSFTAFRRGRDFGVCSRNYTLPRDPNNNWWKAAIKYDVEKALRTEGNYAIQGEMIGPGIQGNKYKLKELDLWVFNVYDINAGKYLNQSTLRWFCARHGLRHVPELKCSKDVFAGVDSVIGYAEGKSALNASTEREGVVFVRHDDDGLRHSFKAISNKFLLGEES